ncbi:MAG: glycoside hydrolase family 57 protein [Acidobacteriota bacterium]|nr:glycoside hydrolase family 57 protein [Acidobacteriota bacterium]
MRVAILWHFHQPIYKTPEAYDYVLPWVNYHATRNYWQMARLAQDGGWPCTFNFVPCLLEQLLDYETGRARDPWQAALEKDPDDLSASEREIIRLHMPPGSDPSAWPKKALREIFSPIDPLPEDRTGLLERQAEIRRRLLPAYGRLEEEGRAELTASAYYHPILPMLCDAGSAGSQRPPGLDFRHPWDASYQLRRGADLFTGIFGHAPRGLWPSEGAVSRETAQLAAEAGFRFAVTDESVLWESLGRGPDPAALTKPYRCQDLTVFFRERELSDLIGFMYARWEPRDAARDLVRRLAEKAREAGEDAVLTLALDGENPWGTYRDNGVPFLRYLYEGLAAEPSLRPEFFGRAAAALPAEPLELAPGTWLGHFGQWSGSPAKNAGWEKLAAARHACGPVPSIYVAEGSDWFWWFGEEPHPAFRRLFDLYIEDAYRQAGVRRP